MQVRKIIENIKDILGEVFFDKDVRLWSIILLLVIYVLGVHIVQRQKNPQLTDTELIILLPKNILLEFHEGE